MRAGGPAQVAIAISRAALASLPERRCVLPWVTCVCSVTLVTWAASGARAYPSGESCLAASSYGLQIELIRKPNHDTLLLADGRRSTLARHRMEISTIRTIVICSPAWQRLLRRSSPLRRSRNAFAHPDALEPERGCPRTRSAPPTCR